MLTRILMTVILGVNATTYASSNCISTEAKINQRISTSTIRSLEFESYQQKANELLKTDSNGKTQFEKKLERADQSIESILPKSELGQLTFLTTFANHGNKQTNVDFMKLLNANPNTLPPPVARKVKALKSFVEKNQILEIEWKTNKGGQRYLSPKSKDYSFIKKIETISAVNAPNAFRVSIS